MEVAYWQVFVFITVAVSTVGFGARVGLFVSIGWTIFSLAMIYTSSLMALQLGTTWIAYFLFREMGRKKDVISKQEAKISTLEQALSDALSGYDAETRLRASEAANRSHHEIIRDKHHMVELRNAIEGSNTSLTIVSGWIRSYVVDRKLTKLLEGALSRGVDIFIGYGWQKSDGTHEIDQSINDARQALDKLASKAARKRGWGKLTIKKNPTHEKVLIKDQDYVICGSNNWLSNKNFKNREQSIKIWDSRLAREMSQRYLAEM
jgi:phosphatidylserine/phosphatidylglycerophosphate/cardiolipin synthase-like enzyme